MKCKKRNSIYIDVDGTLIIKGRPNYPLIKKIIDWHEKGYYLVLWSAAGEEHAKEQAERCGIVDRFKAILTKPEIVVDDLGSQWTRYIKVIKPTR